MNPNKFLKGEDFRIMICTKETEKLNIKDLAFGNPVKDRYVFNPSEIIPHDKYEKYRELIPFPDVKELIRHYAIDLTNLIILFPEKRKELISSKSIEDFFIENNLIAEVSDMRIHYPDKVDDLFIAKHHPYTFEEHKEFTEDECSESRHIWDSFMLFPQRMNEIVSIKELGKKIENQMNESRSKKTWHSFLEHASDLKLMHPLWKVDLSSQEWNEIDSELLKVREDNGVNSALVYYASRAKIIASDNIEMTDKGLVITMPEHKFSKDTLNLPVARRF
jgi:hypothetical protein